MAVKKEGAKKKTKAKTTQRKTTTRKKPAVNKTVKTVTKENDNSVQKAVILVVLLVVFFGVIFMVNNNSEKGKYEESNGSLTTGDAQSESANIKDDEKKDLTNIDINEYLKLKKSDEASIIYIGRPTCSHCQTQKPIMEYMVYKYNVKVNYLNTDELDEKGMNKLQKSDEYFSNGFGTPLILIVKGGEIIDKKEGETTIEDLTEMFKNAELISEE